MSQDELENQVAPGVTEPADLSEAQLEHVVGGVGRTIITAPVETLKSAAAANTTAQNISSEAL